ncbi:MAG TPA: hypothetical protein VL022_04780 [Moheibacter sp.]|nr:hypothetical protein [Moheibacter sp.]
MIIETKFNPGQKVIIILDDEIRKVKINRISIEVDSNGDGRVEYSIRIQGKGDVSYNKTFAENRVFASAEDLFNFIK